MNANHGQLCSSPEWAAHIQNDLLPLLVAGVDLGEEMLEIGPGPGAATEWLRHKVRRLTALELDAEGSPSSPQGTREPTSKSSPAVPPR
jgi:hypothetical protein